MATLTSHVQFAKRLVRLMDIRFHILGIKFGIDPLLTIIPGLGNYLGTVISCYLFWIAYQLRVPSKVYFKMAGNIGVDYLFGLVPFLGIFFDVLFRSNVKNLAILEKYFA